MPTQSDDTADVSEPAAAAPTAETVDDGADEPSQPVVAGISPAAIEGDVAGLSKGAIVAMASPALSGKQRRFLRALGHPLKPTVMIGHQGLGPGLRDAIDAVLERHELVKIKLTENAACSVGAAAVWIHRLCGADVVQILGRTLLAYRQRTKKPEIELPRR